jgi:hypothetical protein
MNNIIIPGIEEMINQQINTVRIINKKSTKDQTIPKIINIMIT